MMKALLFTTLAVVGFQSNATTSVETAMMKVAVKAAHATHGLNWNVGDSADYALTGGGGLINGTAHMFVREAADPGFWLEQDVDLGFQKEKVETLINKDTGAIVEMRVNGEKQDPPAADDETVIDSHKDHITVPKGDFDCFYVKAHSKSQNADSELWVNPELVPIAGMIQMKQPSQIGDIMLQLTDFMKK